MAAAGFELGLNPSGSPATSTSTPRPSNNSGIACSQSGSTHSALSQTPTRRRWRRGGGTGSRSWRGSPRNAASTNRTARAKRSKIARGALFVGSPETVARKIATVARDLRLSRFDLKYDIMHLPREARARTIELLGSEVAPRVRELLAKEPTHV